MSTTPDVGDVVAVCEPADVSPVELSVTDLRSMAPPYLREMKTTLAATGRHPTTLVADADFAESEEAAGPEVTADASTTSEEFDRLRRVVEGASILGAGTLRLSVRGSRAPGVEEGLQAMRERANRTGVTLQVVD